MKEPKTDMGLSSTSSVESSRPVAADYPEIIAHFSTIVSKVEVVQGFLQFGQRFFENVAFFIVTPRSITCLGGAGPNVLSLSAVPSEILIDQVSLIRRAIVNGMKYQGPVPLGTDDSDLFLQFLRGLPDDVALYPGRVSPEVDILFYAETPKGIWELCIPGLEFVIEKATLALKMLYVKQQLKSAPAAVS